ncbi:MAG: hypothetical protein Tsb0013_23930 [Phycisphaerales bacterium]
MKAKLIFAALCFALLGYVVISRGGVAPTPAALTGAGVTDLPSAVAKAKQEGKVVFAVATADWCAPCQTYKRGALADEAVASWIEANAVPLTIDVTDPNVPSPDARALGVSGIPATFLIDSSGQVLASATGALGTDDLLALLTGATD